MHSSGGIDKFCGFKNCSKQSLQIYEESNFKTKRRLFTLRYI